MADPETATPEMVAALCRPEAYPAPVGEVEKIETHISWVFLAGDFAYKFKKPLDLGFLDFRDRERRLHYCREELRLNGRLAPDIYLDLAGARKTSSGWRVGPCTAEAEPAVRMRRFPGESRLDRRLAAGRLDGAALEDFARQLAEFQAGLSPAAPGDGVGDAAAVTRPALANFEALPCDALAPGTADDLARLERWTRRRAAALAPLFEQRLAQGRVREGHGDLHLANLVMLGDRIAAFDGIEFDPALRWIDVQSEVAFLLMDLESREHGELGWRFYNAWLAALGDYDGLAVLSWYLVYRHLVRAKIDGIRLAQAGTGDEESGPLRARLAGHVARALDHAAPGRPLLLLMRGFSGSGKSRLAARLAPRARAAWVRSDLERKRLHGLEPTASASGGVGEGLYDAAATERTYGRLQEIARTALRSGCSLLVDAAFLESERREAFVRLALREEADPVILSCEAPAELLRERVSTRRGDPSDAGLKVLEAQLARPVESGALERQYTLPVDTRGDPDLESLTRRVETLRNAR